MRLATKYSYVHSTLYNHDWEVAVALARPRETAINNHSAAPSRVRDSKAHNVHYNADEIQPITIQIRRHKSGTLERGTCLVVWQRFETKPQKYIVQRIKSSNSQSSRPRRPHPCKIPNSLVHIEIHPFPSYDANSFWAIRSAVPFFYLPNHRIQWWSVHI